MRRREFILVAGAGVMATAPLSVHAQQAMPIIGFLSDATPEAVGSRLAGFHRGLLETGFINGQNVSIEFRGARGNYDLLSDLAADLVRRQVSVIVTTGSERVTRTAKAATTTIPIVATVAGDPVRRGLVASVTRPGGNLTVVSLFTSSDNALVAKRVELAHELVPKATIVGWLTDRNILDYEDELRDLQRAAQALSLEAKVAPVAREGDIEAAFISLVRQGAGAVLEAGPLLGSHRELVVALAAREAMPMLYEWRDFVRDGGLMSYGTDLAEVFRHAGAYAGRILKGEKAGDLPVVQPTKFELVINLKTAKTLGLTIPPSLLARVDEVIE
jgi:putative tryptophan/tyrosine transport system substrate-binding protein